MQRLRPLAPQRIDAGRIPRQFAGATGVLQRLHELAPEHLGQGMHGEQESGRSTRSYPAAGALRVALQCPAGHQRVHMQVPSQVLRMQHQRERADAAEPARVGGKLAEGGGRALHQRVVDPAGMLGRQRVELMRQREHQVAVRHIEQFGQPCCAPSLALTRLALRAVAVAARMPPPLLGTAAIAAKALATQRRGAATDDGAPGARHGSAQAVPAQVAGAEVLQHLGQRDGHLLFSACRSWARRSAATFAPLLRHQADPDVPDAGSASWC